MIRSSCIEYLALFLQTNKYCMFYPSLNSLPIDELGNWCHPRLVGPCANTRHSREVPWQPCEQEPALQDATNRHRHTEGSSVEKLTRPDTYHEPLPTRGGKGWAQIGKIGNQSSDPRSSTEQANCQYGDQSSDPSKVVIHKDQCSRQLQFWRLEPKCKHIARQALVATPQILETAGCIGSRLT